MGGIPADRRDWVEFCSNVAFADGDMPLAVLADHTLFDEQDGISALFTTLAALPPGERTPSRFLGLWQPPTLLSVLHFVLGLQLNLDTIGNPGA